MDFKKEFISTLEKAYQNENDRALQKLLVYYGVKMINSYKKLSGTVKWYLTTIEAIIDIMAKFTPQEIIELFPINIDYNEMKMRVHKDTIYTMEKLEEIGLDEVMGKNVTGFLWGHMNDELEKFNSCYIWSLDTLLKEQGEVPFCTLLSYLDKINVDTSGYAIFQQSKK